MKFESFRLAPESRHSDQKEGKIRPEAREKLGLSGDNSPLEIGVGGIPANREHLKGETPKSLPITVSHFLI